MITTVVTVQNRHVYCRLSQFTGCKSAIWQWSYHDRFCRRRPENGVSDRLRSFTIRWNTTVRRSLPNESNLIKNGRLRPRLIDLGTCYSTITNIFFTKNKATGTGTGTKSCTRAVLYYVYRYNFNLKYCSTICWCTMPWNDCNTMSTSHSRKPMNISSFGISYTSMGSTLCTGSKIKKRPSSSKCSYVSVFLTRGKYWFGTPSTSTPFQHLWWKFSAVMQHFPCAKYSFQSNALQYFPHTEYIFFI
jgi:hypothetical protein